MRESRCELENELLRKAALVERAPAGCMTIDATTALYEIDRTGRQLLGVSREDPLGRPLAGYLSAVGVAQLQALLAQARDGLGPETCPLQLLLPTGGARKLLAAVGMDTVPGRYLVVLMKPVSPRAGGVA